VTCRSLLMLFFLFFLVPQAGAMDDAEWRAFDRLFDSNPNQALTDAEQEMQQAQKRGDKRSELNAICKLAYNWTLLLSIAPPLSREVERGIGLGRELHDAGSLGLLYAVRSAMEAAAGRSADAEGWSQQAVAIAERWNLIRLRLRFGPEGEIDG
jgi:hypothetical protein